MTLLDKLIDGTERAITFPDACRLSALMVSGRPAAVQVIHRYACRGLRGVVLESATVRGRRVTSAEAVARFVRALNQPKPVDPSPVAAVVAGNSHAIAQAELARMGLA